MDSEDARIHFDDERQQADTVDLRCERCGVTGPHETHDYSSGTWARCLSCLNWWRLAPPPKYTYGANHD